MLTQVSVSSLVPNPFRELDDYPIDRDKVDALKESIESTGFWGTIVGRKKGTKYEIAFGHHRMVALQELGLKKCEIIVRDLSNEDMVQMMARENFEEWDTDAYIESQTVESTIRAYGRGDIKLPPVPEKTRQDAIRYVGRGQDSHPYTAKVVAQFLGMTKSDGKGGLRENQACSVAFQIIDAIESGIVTRKELMKLNRDVAREIVAKATALKREQERIAKDKEKQAEQLAAAAEVETDAKKQRAYKTAALRRQAEANAAKESAKEVAKEFAKDAVKQTKSGNWSQRDVREAGSEAKAALHSKKAQRYKDASQYYDGLSRAISKTLNKQDPYFDGLEKLLSMDCGLTQDDIKQLKDEVDALVKRASRFSVELGKWKPAAVAGTLDSQLKIVG